MQEYRKINPVTNVRILIVSSLKMLISQIILCSFYYSWIFPVLVFIAALLYWDFKIVSEWLTSLTANVGYSHIKRSKLGESRKQHPICIFIP